MSAKTNLSGLNYVELGYGQVELNHMAFQWNNQTWAQLPAAAAITLLQQGQFAKYDYANNEVNFTGKGEWLMVYNEEKLYEYNREGHKDFALIKDNYDARLHNIFEPLPVGKKMYPRLVKTELGDIYTTNCVKADPNSLEVGNTLTPGNDGFLVKTTAPVGMLWQVVKITTMADRQPAVKLMRIQ